MKIRGRNQLKFKMGKDCYRQKIMARTSGQQIVSLHTRSVYDQNVVKIPQNTLFLDKEYPQPKLELLMEDLGTLVLTGFPLFLSHQIP